MERYQLGNTPLHITKIGLGLAALGRPAYINIGHADDLGGAYAVEAMQTHAHTVLDAAWTAGIRYFDAARSYGRAEQFLGDWLRQRHIPSQAVTIGSKWGYTYTANWQIEAEQHEIKEHSLPNLQKQWGESQSYLGEWLRLYQIHSATLDSGVLENQAVLRELARLKADSGIAIGLSLSGMRQAAVLQQAIEVRVDGQPLFDTVQATWNLLEPSVGATLQAAKEAGLGVIVKEAVANGRLTARNQRADFATKHTLLATQAERLNTTIDALALAAVLAQPWLDVVLSGAAQVDQLQANLGAVAVAWDDEAASALAELAEPPDVYWKIRKNLRWN